MSQIERLFHRFMRHLRTARGAEYRAVEDFMSECSSILDVGCGTGTFVERDSARRVGVDLNPENVDYCLSRGLDVKVGSSEKLPFADSSFDGIFCSHVFQVFSPDQAAATIKEFGRVVKPGGIVVISTLNNFRNFFQHPENSRPYPPDALLRYFQTQHGSTSPMWPGMPAMKQDGIWLRRPPLLRLRSATKPGLDRMFAGLNQIQYGLYLVKPLSFDSYVIKLRRVEAAAAVRKAH